MKLSVIVTGYGHASWWRNCLASLQPIDVDGTEIICVDDASGDVETAQALQTAAEGDPRIKVVLRAENGGVCVARNDALDRACGEFVTFVDYDDTVFVRGIEDAVDFMSREASLDVCAHGVRIVWEGIGLERTDAFPERFVLHETGSALYREIERRYVRPQLMNYVWNKVYRGSFLRDRGIRFEPHSVCYEDIVFNLDCLIAGAVFGGVPSVGYTWLHHAAGTTLSRYRPWIREGTTAFLERTEAWLEKCGVRGEPWAEVLMRRHVESVRSQIEKNMYRPGSPLGFRERLAELRAGGRSPASAMGCEARNWVWKVVRAMFYRGFVRKIHIRRINPTAVESAEGRESR